MRPRHPLPRLWLMTDERMGDDLWRAVRRLPRGAGVVFRHHATPPGVRRTLFARLRRLVLARGLVLLRAGGMRFAGERGIHGRLTGAAHDRREARGALRAGAALLFVSPVHATRSHPGAHAAGPRGAARIARGMPVARIALGGMDAARFRTLHGFDGWAAIDAWMVGGRYVAPQRQKRKAVPT